MNQALAPLSRCLTFPEMPRKLGVPAEDVLVEGQGPVLVGGLLVELGQVELQGVVLVAPLPGQDEGLLQPLLAVGEVPALPVAVADEAEALEGQGLILAGLGELLDGLGVEPLLHEGDAEMVVDLVVVGADLGPEVLLEIGHDVREVPLVLGHLALDLAHVGGLEHPQLLLGLPGEVVEAPFAVRGAHERDDVGLGEDVGRADLVALERVIAERAEGGPPLLAPLLLLDLLLLLVGLEGAGLLDAAPELLLVDVRPDLVEDGDLLHDLGLVGIAQGQVLEQTPRDADQALLHVEVGLGQGLLDGLAVLARDLEEVLRGGLVLRAPAPCGGRGTSRASSASSPRIWRSSVRTPSVFSFSPCLRSSSRRARRTTSSFFVSLFVR